MITTFFRRRFLIKARMAGDLIRALHLSAQTTAEKMEVLPKLFDLYLPLCKLVLKAHILQVQLLNHHGEIGDGRPVSGRVAPWLCQ